MRKGRHEKIAAGDASQTQSQACECAQVSPPMPYCYIDELICSLRTLAQMTRRDSLYL